MLLIAVGFLLKPKFQQSAAVDAIKVFIINAALPATILLSILTIDTQLDLIALPAFAICINLFLLVCGWLLTKLILPVQEAAKARSLILMFPSLAPGLTAYPFIEEFIGRQGLAWASLADVGNKIFVLIGLYTLALYWRQRLLATSAPLSQQFRGIVVTLFSEPANIAVILGLVLVSFQVQTVDFPDFLADALKKLAACTTPLILFFVGISLQSKGFQFKTILSILLFRSAVGFWFSAGMLTLLQPEAIETIMLMIVLPQVGCSLWPFLYASQMNQSSQINQQGPTAQTSPALFDLDFALAILTTSIPFSICVVLAIFTSGPWLRSSTHLGLAGAVGFGAFSLLSGGGFSYSSRRLTSQKSLGRTRGFTDYWGRVFHWQRPEEIDAYASLLTGVRQGDLRELEQLLHQQLQAEHLEGLTLKCKLNQDTLIVLGHHSVPYPYPQKYFRTLEQTLQALPLRFAQQVSLYLSVTGQIEPYAFYTFKLNGALVLTAAQQGDLAMLERCLQQKLLREFSSLYLRINCVLQENTLIIFGKHLGECNQPQRVFAGLEQIVRSLELKFADQIRVYLTVIGQEEPYAFYSFKLNSSRQTLEQQFGSPSEFI